MPAPEALLQQVDALIARGAWQEAHALLLPLARQSGVDGARLAPALDRRLRTQLQLTAPFWWAGLRHGTVTLRRCRAEDAAFFERCYADQEFARRFNRQRGWSGSLANALKRYGAAPPVQLGMLQWVIEHQGSGALGLASLSSIDMANRRAEFSIGIPGDPPPGVACKASLLAMHFAFFIAGFNKLYTYVYQGNDKAVADTARLGFRQEGLLADHFFLPPDGFVSVHVFGLTKAGLQADGALLRMARRRLGVEWRRGVSSPGPSASP